MIMKMKNKYGQDHKCVCGCSVFNVTYKDKSYSFHCVRCGMYNGQTKYL